MKLDPNKPKLLIVEGESDVSFFKALINNRGLTGFQVVSPWSYNNKKLEGEDAIPHVLKGICIDRDFLSLTHIIVVVDCDNDASEKFIKFQNLISRIDTSLDDYSYPVPTARSEFAYPLTGPAISIFLMPEDGLEGAMETLCLEAGMANKPDLATCIEAFVNCIGRDAFSPQKLAKLKLRCLISAQSAQNPDLPTSKLWEKAPDIVPITSEVFSPISNYLSRIA